jgi:hypothetical protein
MSHHKFLRAYSLHSELKEGTEMLKEPFKQYEEPAEAIDDINRRAAFWYFVGFAAALKDFECEIYQNPNTGGRSLRFKRCGANVAPFSLRITKSEGLTFYVRKPAFNKEFNNIAQVKKALKKYRPTEVSGEVTIKINNPSKAEGVTKYIFGSLS